MPDTEMGVPGTAQAAADPNAGGTPAADPKAGGSQSAFNADDYIPKSEFTKIRQREAAAMRQREEALAARESQLIQAVQLVQQRLAQQQQGQRPDPYAKLRDLPYVQGQDLVETIEQLRGQDIGSIHQAIKQRDEAIKLLYGQLTKVQKVLEGFQGKAVESEFEGRLRKTREELGLPDAAWANEYLKDIYLSHEGDDLVDEFPKLARGRLDEIRKAIRELDKAEAVKAKQLPIPGKGGLTTPSNQLKAGYKSPDQLADEFFREVGSMQDDT